MVGDIWGHAFVGSQGSAWPRLRQALDHGNLIEARSAASELKHVGLAQALELVLLIRDQDPAKFERTALRWHARYCREVRGVGAVEAAAVLALLTLMAGKQGKSAASALADLIYGRRLRAESEALMRWARPDRAV